MFQVTSVGGEVSVPDAVPFYLEKLNMDGTIALLDTSVQGQDESELPLLSLLLCPPLALTALSSGFSKLSKEQHLLFQQGTSQPPGFIAPFLFLFMDFMDVDVFFQFVSFSLAQIVAIFKQ